MMPRTKPLRVLPVLTIASLGLLGVGCSAAADDSPSAVLDVAGSPGGITPRQMGFGTAALGPAGAPIYLGAQDGVAVRDAEEARVLLATSLSQTYHLAPGTDFRLLSDSSDELGGRYFKLQQVHQGVPVAGAEVVVQTEADHAVAAVVGALVPDLRPDVRPTLLGEEAVRRALQGELLAGGPAPRLHEAPTLVVYSAAGEPAVLAYRAVVQYLAQDGVRIDEVFASAADGRLTERRSQIYTALDRKVYNLSGKCLTSLSVLPGTLLMSEGETSTDTAAQAVYDGLGDTYYYYKYFHGRDSYDNKGARLSATVHMTFQAGLGSCSGANAAWIAQASQMVYGDGDAADFKNLALGLDVTAHELTHAVTSSTSNLTYSREPGALNEAMSDILGSAGTEDWVESGGTSAGNPTAMTPSAKTWKIGEDVIKPTSTNFPDGALRFMDNPTKDKYSKDWWPERLTSSSDNYGVHGNSGIANLAFYLLSQGGGHPRSKTTATATGIGIEKALKIYFLANTKLFTASTDFQAARYATARAAETLYGRCSAERNAVHQSWDVVGVQGGWSLCKTPRPRF